MMPEIFMRDVLVFRHGIGDYDINGVWVEEAGETFLIRASVQPLPEIAMDTLPEGYRTKSAFILYTNTELFTSQKNNNKPDSVMLDGDKYLVTKKKIWQNTPISHYEIIVVKEEKDVN